MKDLMRYSKVGKSFFKSSLAFKIIRRRFMELSLLSNMKQKGDVTFSLCVTKQIILIKSCFPSLLFMFTKILL